MDGLDWILLRSLVLLEHLAVLINQLDFDAFFDINHFKISIFRYGQVKLPMISELPIYLLSIFFPQYIIHPYSAGRMRVSNGGQVCGGVQIMLLGDGFGICIRSYLKFGTFDRHRQK